MPLAFDVDYAEITSSPSQLIGDMYDAVDLDGGVIHGGESEYAYIIGVGPIFCS